MANWFTNYEAIFGPKEEIKSLYEKLIEWSKPVRDELPDIRDIVEKAGIDPEKFYCRGSITESFAVKDYDENNAVITFESETAWGTIDLTWNELLKKYAPHCNYYYVSYGGYGVDSLSAYDPLGIFVVDVAAYVAW